MSETADHVERSPSGILKEGDKITVFTDNDTSLNNLVTFLKDQGLIRK